MIFGFIMTVFMLVVMWKLAKKLGREGWEGIVPLYNIYLLFEVLYGNGWKFLLLLIPLYNIYVIIKLFIDLAHGFHKSTGFGIGLLFLSPIFAAILAFDKNCYYGDGTIANTSVDILDTVTQRATEIGSSAVDKTKTVANNMKKGDDDVAKLEKLKSLLDQGVITEEEFNEKKADILSRL